MFHTESFNFAWMRSDSKDLQSDGNRLSYTFGITGDFKLNEAGNYYFSTKAYLAKTLSGGTTTVKLLHAAAAAAVAADPGLSQAPQYYTSKDANDGLKVDEGTASSHALLFAGNLGGLYIYPPRSLFQAIRGVGFTSEAFYFADYVAQQLPEGGALSGPGTYAIHFCLKNPALSAAVFDLPTTRPFAEKTIARFHLDRRVTFSAGDYHSDDIPGRFDVAWLSHILHGDGPDACLRLIRKAVGALEPGGLIIVHEFILDDTLDGPVFPALFSLNMLLGTESGRAYSEAEIRSMLAAAGVRDIRRVPVKTPNDSGVISGIV